MDTLFENDDLKIGIEKGDGSDAVVSFSGISFGFLNSGEFRGSLSGRSSDVYCVFDKGRKWFNGNHERAAVDILNEEIERRSTRLVYTLGNSMGGTGAVSLARDLLNCKRVLGFCPQSSVHPDFAPFETRWAELRCSISDWTLHDSIDRISPARDYFLFFGRDDPLDMRHAARFSAGESTTVHVFFIEDCGHDVALQLKRRGALSPIIDLVTGPMEVSAADIHAVVAPQVRSTRAGSPNKS